MLGEEIEELGLSANALAKALDTDSGTLLEKAKAAARQPCALPPKRTGGVSPHDTG